MSGLPSSTPLGLQEMPKPALQSVHQSPAPRMPSVNQHGLALNHLPQQGRPQFRIGDPIPAGVQVTTRDNPSVELHPYHGPMGFGVYRNSVEVPGAIDFRPVIDDLGAHARSSQVRAQPPTAAASMESGMHVHIHPPSASPVHAHDPVVPDWRPTLFPYGPPPPRRPSPPPDLIDPNWLAWWHRIAGVDYTRYAPHFQELIRDRKILPMLNYISKIRGPNAALYTRQLEKLAEELGHRREKEEAIDNEIEKSNPYAKGRGMLGKPEYYKPVALKDSRFPERFG